MEDENGVLIEGEDRLHVLATRYFKDLFMTKPMHDNDSLMSKIEPRIEKHYNEELMTTFSKELEALKSMVPVKSDRY